MERDRPELDAAAAQIGADTDPGRILAVQGDVTSADDARAGGLGRERRLRQARHAGQQRALGPQEHSPTNTAPRRPIWEADLDLWLATVAVNSSGPFIMTRAALPGMLERNWGRIVNVTTSLDTMLNAGLGPYGPAKAATEALTSILGVRARGDGSHRQRARSGRAGQYADDPVRRQIHRPQLPDPARRDAGADCLARLTRNGRG